MARTQYGWGRRLGIALLILLAAIFSFLNAGERVSMNVGVTTLYRISLVGLVFSVFLLGMVTMFLFGIQQDRRVRALLRARPLDSSATESSRDDQIPGLYVSSGAFESSHAAHSSEPHKVDPTLEPSPTGDVHGPTSTDSLSDSPPSSHPPDLID